MGDPGQLFTFEELKSRTEKDGEKLKREAINRIQAAAAEDIARVIIVTRKAAPPQDDPQAT